MIMSFNTINVLAQNNNINDNADVNVDNKVDNNGNKSTGNNTEDLLYTNLTYGAGGLVIGGVLGYLIFKKKDTL